MPGLIKYDRFEQFTGGGGGINLFESAARTRPLETTDPITFETIAEPIKFLGLEIGSFNEWLYYLSWGVALLMFVVAWLLVRGKSGRSFRAVRDSELAAASSGVNLATYKTLAFGISAFYAGVAGSLLAIATTFVNPDTYPITLSIFLLVGVVVGGLGSLWPLVFGAIFIQFLPLWAQEVSKAQGAPAVVYGVILILVMIMLPGGAAGLIDVSNRLQVAATIAVAEPFFRLQGGCTNDASTETSPLPARARRRDRDRRHRRDERRPRGQREDDSRGGTTPLSGTASAYASVARGANAYFKYVNSRGGVNGRTITYKTLDDAYDPGKTVQATKQLVEQDKVFAIFNSLGTEQNLATRDYLNAAKVPQLFVASGATTFGRDFKKYPWTIGFQPSYRAEGWIRQVPRPHEAGRQGRRPRPERRLRQGSARRAQAGDRALEGEGRRRAVVEVTDPDVQSQIARLKASGANVLALFATPRHAIQGYVFANRLGWRPLIINNAVSSASNIMTLASEGGSNKAVENSISIVFLKDPTDAKWRNEQP